MNDEQITAARKRAIEARKRSQAAGKPQQPASTPDQQKANNNEFHAKKTMPEYKTRRFQLVFKPSLYERVKQRADFDGVSMNEFIMQLLEKNV